MGGALAILGYRYGHHAPTAAVFMGTLLALALAPDWAPMQEHHYWGPFPSSDVHAEAWPRSLLVTVTLATALSLLGYVGVGWLNGRAAGKPA